MKQQNPETLGSDQLLLNKTLETAENEHDEMVK